MRRLRVSGVVLTLILVSAPAIRSQDAAVVADCDFDPARLESARDRWRRVSQDVETLAPSRRLTPVANATSSSRRRAVPHPVPPTFVRTNFVDDEIFGKMIRDGIRWTSPAGDAEYLRRVTLDLTGQIPDPATVKAFLASTEPSKREKEVDRLLASDAFADRWALWFGDHVQNTVAASNTVVRSPARNTFAAYIRTAIAAGKPYDEMVREILSTPGKSFTDGPVNYYARQMQDNGPIQDTWDNLSADTGEKFLGLPLNCLSCHGGLLHLEQVNSGLVKKTRTDFWKNAAFFAQTIATVNRQGSTAGDVVVGTSPTGGEYRLNTRSGNKTQRSPNPGQSDVVAPAFFLSGEGPAAGEDRRKAYARILTAHPQFARASVNYLWKEVFGLGIVEPADSFDLLRQDAATLAANAVLQPTHPELLTKLANEFAAKNYDLRAILKTMVMSSAYGLSARYTPGEWSDYFTPYFARRYARRLHAEMVLDAVVKATSVPINLPVQNMAPPPAKAIALPDVVEPGRNVGAGAFLNAFGRGDRDLNPRGRDSSIVQTLMLLNDPIVATRVRATGNSTTDKLLKSTRDPAAITDELYVATLGRLPSAAEKQAAVAYLSDGDIVKNTEDLQFALINRLEFLFN